MKKIALLILFQCALAYGYAQIKVPAPSPTQTVKQDFGLSFIELSYSRPGLKDRKAFGPDGVRPYDVVWRTGANSATTLNFGDAVTIGDKEIPAGKYGLLTIPGKDEWTIILSKQTDVTSPAEYKQEEDLVRLQAKPIVLPMNIETMTISFNDITANSCKVFIAWGNTIVSFPITTNVDDKIMASIDASLKSGKPAYFQAGVYYLENNKDLNKAVEWLGKAAAAQPDAFWAQYQLAKALAKAGKKEEAKKAALQSIELAKKAKNDDYVALNEKLIAEL